MPAFWFLGVIIQWRTDSFSGRWSSATVLPDGLLARKVGLTCKPVLWKKPLVEKGMILLPAEETNTSYPVSPSGHDG